MNIIPAGPASGVSFSWATKHIPSTRFRSVIFSHSGLHIPGRSLTRSTHTCGQKGAGACRPASTKSPESPAGYLIESAQ